MLWLSLCCVSLLPGSCGASLFPPACMEGGPAQYGSIVPHLGLRCNYKSVRRREALQRHQRFRG